jgi:hypothetical protein
MAGCELVKDTPERKQVGAVIDGLPRACSGAMYAGVPITAPLCVRPPPSRSERARSKSRIRARLNAPVRVHSSQTLLGLMSR